MTLGNAPASGPEQLPRAEALDATHETQAAGTQLEASDQRIRLAGALSAGSGTEKLIQGELQTAFGQWQRLTRGRIQTLQLHSQTEHLLSEFESLDHPIGRDMARTLRQLVKESNPDPEANPRINPAQILKTINYGLGYLQDLRLNGAAPAGFYPSLPLLQQAQAMLLNYAGAIGTPPQGTYLNQPTTLRPTAVDGAQYLDRRLYPNVGYSRERYARTGTMLQIGGLFLLAPTAAAMFGLALMEHDDDKRAERLNSSLLWAGALVANCMAHNLLKVGKTGNVELVNATDRWLQEIGFLGQINGDYVRLANTYGLRDPGVRTQLAEMAEEMSGPSLPPEISKLLRRKTALQPAEQEQILDHFAPGGSPLRPALSAMMQSGSLRPGGAAGHDFRALIALFGVKRSANANAFIKSFLLAGAGPADFAALPTQG